MMMEMNDSILVAGARGLAGSAIVRHLRAAGFRNLLLPTSTDLDLRDQSKTFAYFCEHRPAFVFMAAARVGGILANDSYPADFIYDNLLIEANVIEAARRAACKKLLFLGSACIYPKHTSQPIQEEHLLTGELEPTNQWYAVAKIAGIKLCQAYRRQHGMNAVSVMPTNLYGPGDNFDLATSHVLPALIRKFHEAKERGENAVTIWGTGKPRREFLHVDDLADACLFLMDRYEGEDIINVGVGEDVSIEDLAALVRSVVGFQGQILNDTSKPDGTPQRLLDSSRVHELGWRARIGLREGVEMTYRWFLENRELGLVRAGSDASSPQG